MQKALSVVRDPVVLVDRRGMIQYLNKNAENLLKCEQRSVLGKVFWDLYPLLNSKTKHPVEDILKGIQSPVSEEFFLEVSKNQELSTSIQISPINFIDDSPEKLSYAFVIQDTSEKKILESRLKYLDRYDGASRLPNRKSIEITLKHALTDVRKHSATHVFCYISLDKIKNVTDTAGHAAGDALMTQLSDVLRPFAKSERDVLARVSNDDFAILYREKEPAPTLKLINQMLEVIEDFEFIWQGSKFRITASIGFLLVHKKTATSATQVLSDTDIASRIAREKGGNRVFIYHPNDDAVQARKGNIEWVQRIRHAIQHNMFKLFSQPIHPLAVQSIPFFHYETLIRLFDEEGNQIPPDEFLPSAEQQGLMMEVDKWVVKEALKNLKKITQKTPLPMFSINLSGQSINEPQFLDFVLREIQSVGVNPHMICFEITESVAVNDMGLAMKFIKSLKSLGCSFSLDDFGTGVSSYGYLRELPVDFLKIDGIFVKDMETDLISQEMVRSINQVGHAMNLEVIAEYVENDEIINILNEIGVDYGQGYGISRPMPIEEVVATHIV
jgi:diguanylate cyclase (GGDEF)-like protein/PAS domain S-box-containing protein